MKLELFWSVFRGFLNGRETKAVRAMLVLVKELCSKRFEMLCQFNDKTTVLPLTLYTDNTVLNRFVSGLFWLKKVGNVLNRSRMVFVRFQVAREVRSKAKHRIKKRGKG